MIQISYSPMSLLWTCISPLKYLTVFTLSSSVASSSQTKMAAGCIWKALTVHKWLMPSSMAMWRASALATLVIRIMTSRASITVPTPTVSAIVGTLEMSLLKKRAFATIVSWASVLRRVRDTKLEPGSLNAMWPSGPIPY